MTLLEQAKNINRKRSRMGDPDRDAVLIAYLRGEIGCVAAAEVLGIHNSIVSRSAANALKGLVAARRFEIRELPEISGGKAEQGDSRSRETGVAAAILHGGSK